VLPANAQPERLLPAVRVYRGRYWQRAHTPSASRSTTHATHGSPLHRPGAPPAAAAGGGNHAGRGSPAAAAATTAASTLAAASLGGRRS
jgi:hypothetical protein